MSKTLKETLDKEKQNAKKYSNINPVEKRTSDIDKKIFNPEYDPSGLKQGDTGAKFDAGKIQMSLLKRFGLAFIAMADLATSGATKYTRDGWADVPDGINRYDDAMLGHIFREVFEDEDPDMNQHHHVSTVWNAMARLQKMIEENPEWKNRLMKRSHRPGSIGENHEKPTKKFTKAKNFQCT